MDCFPDFCLGCDSEAVDGLYCSESCRMIDLSRSSSGMSSPVHNMSTNSRFVFPTTFGQPPIPSTPLTNKSSTTAHLSSRPRYHSHSAATSSVQHSPHRVLSPSSSRSSLISQGQQETVSDEAAKELLSYFNAFDRTRDQRRKSLPVSLQSSWALKVNDKAFPEH